MQLSELSWPVVERLDKRTPVVIPIAAIEQHGHHLPLVTDSMLLGEIVKRVDAAMGDRVVFAPLMWLGNSDHHLDFSGTLSCPPRVYLDLLNGLVENILRHGFRRVLVLNGHGGNDVPGKQALFEVRQRHRQQDDLLLLFSTYWSLAPHACDGLPGLCQREMGHACEWETSMILNIAPELVGDYRQAPEVAFGNAFLPASRAWITQQRTGPGHIGCPHQATIEKGAYLLETFSQSAQDMLRRMLDWNGHSWEG